MRKEGLVYVTNSVIMKEMAEELQDTERNVGSV